MDSDRIRRSIQQRVDDERQVLHAVIVNVDITTASMELEPLHFVEPAHGDVWAVLVALEDAGHPRTIGHIVERLKRQDRYCGRLMRQILSSDPTVALTHTAWCAGEIRRHAADNEQIQAAVAIIDKFSN
jgi:replicative DNA helicase